MNLISLCSPFISVSILQSLSLAEFGLSQLFLAAPALVSAGLLAESALVFTCSRFLAVVAGLFPSTLSIFTRQRVCRRPIASKSSSEHSPRLRNNSNTWHQKTYKKVDVLVSKISNCLLHYYCALITFLVCLIFIFITPYMTNTE